MDFILKNTDYTNPSESFTHKRCENKKIHKGMSEFFHSWCKKKLTIIISTTSTGDGRRQFALKRFISN